MSLPRLGSKLSADDAVSILYSVYQNMFSCENSMQQLARLNMGDLSETLSRSFTRKAWVASIVAVKANVDTDWDATMESLYNLVQEDSTSPMTGHHMQDLGVYLHLHGLYSTMQLKTPPSALFPFSASFGINPATALPELMSMPSAVCLIMRVLRGSFFL